MEKAVWTKNEKRYEQRGRKDLLAKLRENLDMLKELRLI